MWCNLSYDLLYKNSNGNMQNYVRTKKYKTRKQLDKWVIRIHRNAKKVPMSTKG
jgi:hypothetical protein